MPCLDLRRSLGAGGDGGQVRVPVLDGQPAVSQGQALIAQGTRGQHPAEGHRFAGRDGLRPAELGGCARLARAFQQQHRLQVRQAAHLQGDCAILQRQEEHGQRPVLAGDLSGQVEAQRLGPVAAVAHGEAPADCLRLHRPEFGGQGQGGGQPGADAQQVRGEGREHGRGVVRLRLVDLAPADAPHRHDARQADSPAVARLQAERRLGGAAQAQPPDLVIVVIGAPGAGVRRDAGGHRVAGLELPCAHERPR